MSDCFLSRSSWSQSMIINYSLKIFYCIPLICRLFGVLFISRWGRTHNFWRHLRFISFDWTNKNYQNFSQEVLPVHVNNMYTAVTNQQNRESNSKFNFREHAHPAEQSTESFGKSKWDNFIMRLIFFYSMKGFLGFGFCGVLYNSHVLSVFEISFDWNQYGVIQKSLRRKICRLDNYARSRAETLSYRSHIVV